MVAEFSAVLVGIVVVQKLQWKVTLSPSFHSTTSLPSVEHLVPG